MRTEKELLVNDEISFKELILKGWEYFYHLLRNWKLICFSILIGFSLNLYSYFSHIPKYAAKITFMINEDESSSLGGIGSLLGSFSGLLGGGASDYNLDKVLEISKSDRIAEKILLQKIIINDKKDYTANHLIESVDTIDQWLPLKWYKKPFEDVERKTMLRNYRFSLDTIDYRNKTQTYVLKQLINLLFGPKKEMTEGIVRSEYGEVTGIMKLETSTLNEDLSIKITNSIFAELSEFYIKKSTEKQQQTFDLMKTKHDSINSLLSANEFSLARFQDTNRGLYKISDQVKKDQYQREIFILATALGEAKKNLEISDFALRNKTPFIQVIDRPFSPLNNTRPGIFKILISGLIFGAFFGIFVVLILKIYRDIMA